MPFQACLLTLAVYADRFAIAEITEALAELERDYLDEFGRAA